LALLFFLKPEEVFMGESKKKRDEMIRFAKKLADKITEKYPGAELDVLELVRMIMNANEYCQKQTSA